MGAFTIAVLDTRHHDRWHTSSIVGLSTALNRPTTRDESAAVFTVSPVVAIKNLRGHNIRHSRFLSVTTRPTAEELIFQEAFNLPQDISFMECFLKMRPKEGLNDRSNRRKKSYTQRHVRDPDD